VPRDHLRSQLISWASEPRRLAGNLFHPPVTDDQLGSRLDFPKAGQSASPGNTKLGTWLAVPSMSWLHSRRRLAAPIEIRTPWRHACNVANMMFPGFSLPGLAIAWRLWNTLEPRLPSKAGQCGCA